MRVLIVGAGGQGIVVASILGAMRDSGGAELACGFLDDRENLAKSGASFLGIPVLGTIDSAQKWPHEGVVVAIGNNAARRRISEILEARGEQLVTVRHPFSSVGPEVTIGRGSMISAGAIITAASTIGRGVILNTKSSVDHHCVVGDFAHLGPGSTLGGDVTIGEEVLLGLGAAVMPQTRVGDRSMVGAGALVHRDLPAGVVATGVPARVQRQLDRSD